VATFTSARTARKYLRELARHLLPVFVSFVLRSDRAASDAARIQLVIINSFRRLFIRVMLPFFSRHVYDCYATVTQARGGARCLVNKNDGDLINPIVPMSSGIQMLAICIDNRFLPFEFDTKETRFAIIILIRHRFDEADSRRGNLLSIS